MADAAAMLAEWGGEVERVLGGYDYTVTGWSGEGFVCNAIRALADGAEVARSLGKPRKGSRPGIPADTVNAVSWAITIFEDRLEKFAALKQQAAQVREIEDRTGTRLKSWNDATWLIRTWVSFSDGKPTGVTFHEYCEAKASDRICSGDAVPRANGARPRAHSSDFGTLVWNGTEYKFSKTQAACIKILFENWQNGTPEVMGETLLEASLSSREELRLIFRNSGAWGTLITSPRKGFYRLAEHAAVLTKRKNISRAGKTLG